MKFGRSFLGYDRAGVDKELEQRYLAHKRGEEGKQQALTRAQNEKEELAARLDSLKAQFEGSRGIVLLTEKYQKYVMSNLIEKANQVTEQKINQLLQETEDFEKDIQVKTIDLDDYIAEIRREIKSVLKVVEDLLEFNDFGQANADLRIKNLDNVINQFQQRAETQQDLTVLKDDYPVLPFIDEAEYNSQEKELAETAVTRNFTDSLVLDRQNKNILLAENDEDTAILTRQALEQEGFQVKWAKDGHQLSVLISEGLPPILVLLNLKLPGIDGLQVIKEIRAREGWQDLTIIGMTDHYNEEEIIEILDSGAGDCLQKPFNPKELAARVIRFCGSAAN